MGSWRLLWLAVGIVVLLGGLLVLIVYVPQRVIDPHGLSAAERLNAASNLRTDLLQALGGMALLGTLYFSARTLQLNRRGQVTERFTKAIDQLGQLEPEKLAVRLGGIYALEQIALDSEDMHWPTVEVLTAFLRENSRTSPASQTARTSVQVPGASAPDAGESKNQSGSRPRTDLQAIATVLGRRPARKEAGRRLDLRAVMLPRVDLSGGRLQKADLSGAQLQDASLGGAQFQEADLTESNLQGARLAGAQFQEANLTDANLQRAHLAGAQLQRAYLLGAQLQEANLADAQLQGAHFAGAQLMGAYFRGANLQGAHLDGSRGLTHSQLREALLDSKTVLPPGLLEGAGGTDRDAG
jgi:uncharacterized protein YjbI with pentapeptide repeats